MLPSLGEARGDDTAEGLDDLGKSSILRLIGGPPAPERRSQSHDTGRE